MNEAERQEFNRFKEQLEEVTDDVLPIVNDITVLYPSCPWCDGWTNRE